MVDGRPWIDQRRLVPMASRLHPDSNCIMIAHATHISSNGFSFLVACMATLSQHAKVGNKVYIRGTRHVLNLVLGLCIA